MNKMTNLTKFLTDCLVIGDKILYYGETSEKDFKQLHAYSLLETFNPIEDIIEPFISIELTAIKEEQEAKHNYYDVVVNNFNNYPLTKEDIQYIYNSLSMYSHLVVELTTENKDIEKLILSQEGFIVEEYQQDENSNILIVQKREVNK